MIIRNTDLVGVEAHWRTFCEVNSFQFPFEGGHSSEERSTKFIVPHHRTEQSVSEVDSHLWQWKRPTNLDTVCRGLSD